MQKYKQTFLWKQTLLLIVLMLIVGACTGLAGEPEIVATIPVRATSMPSAPETFEHVVNLEQGALIYAENCVRCHGITGTGNGELVLSGQVQNVPDFTDSTTIAEISLQDWFDTITNGRIENLMPPWKDSLSAQDRWAVALYTYTMSYNTTLLNQGEAAYTAQCVDCHAEDGSGTDSGISLQGLTSFSEASLQDTVSSHHADLALSPALEAENLSTIVQYMRLLSAESQTLPDPNTIVTQPQPSSTEEAVDIESVATPATIPQSIGVLRGRIIQGTEAGGSVEGLEAVIHIYDSQLQEQISEYTVGADGAYQFEEVVIRPDFAYRMTVNYDGITYTSPVFIGDPTSTEIILDVVIYEPGATANDLVMTSRATQINLSSQGLYIIEVIDMLNTSDRTYLRDVEGMNEQVSVGFAIPQGAQLQLDHTDPNRIGLNASGDTVYDLSAVLPRQEHYVQYSYLIPFEDATSIQQPIDYNVAGPIAFFIENSHLEFMSDPTERTETRTFNGQEYNVHTVNTSPNIGDVINYSVNLLSNPIATTSVESQTIPRELLALVLVIGGVVLIGGAGVIILRGRTSSDAPDLSRLNTLEFVRTVTELFETHSEANSILSLTSEELIKRIAEIDNLYEVGKLEKADYEKQRDYMKSLLMRLMKAEESNN